MVSIGQMEWHLLATDDEGTVIEVTVDEDMARNMGLASDAPRVFLLRIPPDEANRIYQFQSLITRVGDEVTALGIKAWSRGVKVSSHYSLVPDWERRYTIWQRGDASSGK